VQRPLAKLAIFLIVLGGHERAAAQPADPAYAADAAKLIEATGATRIADQMAAFAAAQMIDGLRKANKADLPPRALEITREVIQSKFSAALRTENGLVQRLVPVYMKHFTHDEIRGLLAFYATPLGKKTITVLPELTQQSVEAGRDWAVSLAPEVNAELQRRLKAEGIIK
jgi:hypothetical protein